MKILIILSLAVLMTACGGAGSGEGLDEQGRPITDDNDPTPSPSPDPGNDEVSLQRIQDEIFGAICIQCHVGASAPRGLRLDSIENSFNFLVGVEADEVPELLRVEPGDPDNSYLVKKIEGAADIVGARMPLGQPALSSEQIQLIRDWISAGAPAAEENAFRSEKTQANMYSVQKNADSLQFNVYFTQDLAKYSISSNNILLYGQHDDTNTLIYSDDYHVSSQGDVLVVTYEGELHEYDAMLLQLHTDGLDGIRDNRGELVNIQGVANSEGGISYVLSM